MTPRSALASLLAGTLLVCGCGYRVGGASLYRSNVETVHVAVFDTRAFRRDLEFQLTEAVKKRINVDTPYRLAAPENADTILSGEVLGVRQAAFARDYESRLPREKTLTLGVRLKWKDLRSGRVLVERDVELQAVDYLPPAGESEALARDRAVDRMAARIVAELYSEW